MHLHEEPASEGKLSLPQHRVTPEELTRALAAIEARKQEASRRQEAERAYLESTIPVDEAVRELNLEATPDEIWAEVEAQRAAEPGEELPLECGKAAETPEPAFTALPQPHTQVAPVPASGQRRRGSRWQITSVLLAASAIGLITFSHRHHFFSPLAANVPSAHAAASAYNVSNFPDAIPFELTGEQLNRVLHGDDTSAIGVDPGTSYNTNHTPGWWSLIKYAGHVYLRGWIAAPPTKDALPGRFVDIDNMELVPENGNRPAEVTLRLDMLKYCSFYERITVHQAAPYAANAFPNMDEKITVSDVHLDQHAWERAGSIMSTKEPWLPARWMHRIIKEQEKLNKPDPRLLRNTGGLSIAAYTDGKPFVLPYEQLSYLLTGTPTNAVSVPADHADLDHPERSGGWLAVKHQGNFYLRGWVAEDVNQEGMAGYFLHLYNAPSAPELGGAAKQISLRLGKFQYGPSGRFYARKSYFGTGNNSDDADLQQIPLSDVHLDDHAWEKW